LDRTLREDLMNELRAILKQVAVTAIYVTHDQQEAFAIADRVVILNQGRIEQQGTPPEVYQRPNSPWVARFLGFTNLIGGRVVATQPLRIETPIGPYSPHPVEKSLSSAASSPAALAGTTAPDHGTEQLAIGRPVTILIRPEAARLAADCSAEEDMILTGELMERSFRGGHHRLVLRHNTGQKLTFELVTDAARLPEPGERIELVLRPEAISLLPQLSSSES
jgi:ABC-type Fe3+/spermidine/putrescine transport system ATPase subunit